MAPLGWLEMKFDLEKAFPYPVLRPGAQDYLDAEFQIGVSFAGVEDRIRLDFVAAISSDEINREIDAGNAQYMCVISCRNTYFSTYVSSGTRSFSVLLRATDLHGPVDVDKYVVAIKPIPSFSSEDFNPEFQGLSIDLEVNDVLAQDSPDRFYVGRSPMKPLESVVDFIANTDMERGLWSVATDNNHLQIHLNPADKDVLDTALHNKAHRPYLLNSILVSAVNAAIIAMQSKDEELEGLDWHVAICAKLDEMGINISNSDSLEITQRLLASPLSSLISTFQMESE